MTNAALVLVLAHETTAVSWRRHVASDSSRATQDSNLRPSVPETLEEAVEEQGVWVLMTPDVTRRADAALRMAAEGDGRGVAAALDVCGWVKRETKKSTDLNSRPVEILRRKA